MSRGYTLACERCGDRLRTDRESSDGICRHCRSAEALRDPSQCPRCGGTDGAHVEGMCSRWRDEPQPYDDEEDKVDESVRIDPEEGRGWRDNLRAYVEAKHQQKGRHD